MSHQPLRTIDPRVALGLLLLLVILLGAVLATLLAPRWQEHQARMATARAVQVTQTVAAGIDQCRGARIADRWPEAVQLCGTAIAIAPGDVDAAQLYAESREGYQADLYRRTMVLLDADDREAALVVAEELYAYNPGYRDVAQVLRRLRAALTPSPTPSPLIRTKSRTA